MPGVSISPAECYRLSEFKITPTDIVSVDSQFITLGSNNRTQAGTYDINVQAIASDGTIVELI